MPRGASTDGQRRHRGGIARCRYLFFRRAGPRTRRASHDRRRLVRARHWTARPARRDRHDAYAGRPRPDRTLAISRAACGRRSPERPGERSGLPACDVRRGRPRRYARPAPPTRRAARRRSGPVRRRVSALLRPRPRGHSHRAGRANRLTPDTRSGVIPQHWSRRLPGTFTPEGAAASAMDAAAPGDVVYGWGPTFLGAPPDNLPAEQGLKAGGGTTKGQGPLAYPCSSEVQNLHGERHVLRMATWKADELTDDVQGDASVEVLFPARNFAEDVPRKGAADL